MRRLPIPLYTLFALLHPTVIWQGELYVFATDWKVYVMPCGDLCAKTCLEQADSQPTYKVRDGDSVGFTRIMV